MKIYQINDTLLCLAACFTLVTCAVVPDINCPGENVFKVSSDNKCVCLSSLKYLICNKVDVKENVTFGKMYSFNSVIIKDSPKLTNLLDSSDVKNLAIDSLVIENNLPELEKLSGLSDITKLLELPTGSIKVDSMKKIPQTFEISKLSPKLKSLSISKVSKLTKFQLSLLKNLTQLRHIQFRDVQFETVFKDPSIVDLPLTRVEFSQTNIAGTFKFSPKNCQPGEKVYVELHGNDQLTGFDFEALFKSAKDCKFHVDLSDNSKLDPDFLSKKQIDIIKANPEKIYLLLKNVKINCSCELYQLYHDKKFTNYIHGVQCQNGSLGFLDSIDEAKGGQLCKK